MLAWGFASWPMLAGEPGVAPRQHLEATWDMKDGLPDNVVNTVVQTRDH